MRRVHEPGEVLVDSGSHVAGLVPHPEAAAEVVDVEGAERRQGSHLGLELLQVQDLRPDVGVHPAHLDHRRGVHPGQRLGHLL